jgi:hypothetical protein
VVSKNTQGEASEHESNDRPHPYTIFTVATGPYVTYARILAATLREHGERAPFIAYTDGSPVPEADATVKISWDYRRRMKYSPERWFVKLYLLKDLAREIDGYAVFMDADIYARRPFDLTPLLCAPVGALLENDLEAIAGTEWMNVTCGEIVGYLRALGYDGTVWSLNAGLFSVNTEAARDVLDLVYRFKERHAHVGEQPALAYAIGCLGAPAPRIDDHRDLYDSNPIEDEWVDSVLAGRPWRTLDYLARTEMTVDPALVHYASQKHAISTQLGQGLEALSPLEGIRRARARLASPTFGQVLDTLGLLHENEPGAIPRRAAL